MQILNVYKSRNDNGQQFGWGALLLYSVTLAVFLCFNLLSLGCLPKLI